MYKNKNVQQIKDSLKSNSFCLDEQINELIPTLQRQVDQVKNSYNSAKSNYESNLHYYSNLDKTTYDSNTLNITHLQNTLRGKTEDVQRFPTIIQNKNTQLNTKITDKNEFLNNLSEQKLSHLLIKAIENNNVEVQDLVKVKDFDPSYKMKNGTGKYLLEVEITHNKQELFDLTMSKNPKITQEAKDYLLGISNNNQFFTIKLCSLNPITLEAQDNLDLEEEMALLDINNREEIIETLGNDNNLDHEMI